MGKEKRLDNLSDKQIENLQKMGFEVKIENIYFHICPFCSERIEKKDAKTALRSFNMHLGKCKNHIFTMLVDKTLPEGARGGDIVYLLEGKFPNGYKPKDGNIKALETLRKRIKQKDKI